jgi:TetR/AcrR family transcriptional regulator, transcriptional repressor for nem operon
MPALLLTDRSRYVLMAGMGRVRQFDRQAALDDAVELFWARGYHATSIQDLVDHLGVNRQSLYDTFGGKDALFHAALERYRERQSLPLRRALAREGRVGDVLRESFRLLVAELLKGDGKGCLMTNTVAELAAQDEAVFRLCSATAREQEAVFAGLLARAQADGEIAADRPVIPLARFLVSTVNGLGVTAKATRDRKVLEDVVEVALSALGL